jgi:HlyD family secretion protein
MNDRLLAISFGLLVTAAAYVAADDPAAKGRAQAPAAKAKTPNIVTAIGRVEPTEVVEIGAMVAGPVQKVTADYGHKVLVGEVLAQLDPAPYQIAVDRAKASLLKAQVEMEVARAKLALAKRNFERLSKLRDAGAVGDVEAAKAELEVAEATLQLTRAGIAEQETAVRRAELDLSRCTIRSPISGVVLSRRCTEGQIVAAGAGPGLFQIARDPKTLHVLAAVSEADITRIKVGQEARITVDALPDQTFQAKVTQVRLNPGRRGSGTYTMVIAVDNPDDKLLPYLTAKVSIAVVEPR